MSPQPRPSAPWFRRLGGVALAVAVAVAAVRLAGTSGATPGAAVPASEADQPAPAGTALAPRPVVAAPQPPAGHGAASTPAADDPRAALRVACLVGAGRLRPLPHGTDEENLEAIRLHREAIERLEWMTGQPRKQSEPEVRCPEWMLRQEYNKLLRHYRERAEELRRWEERTHPARD